MRVFGRLPGLPGLPACFPTYDLPGHSTVVELKLLVAQPWGRNVLGRTKGYRARGGIEGES